MAVDPEGLPLASAIFPGNTQDVSTVPAMIAKRKGLGVQQCLFGSDSGMVSAEHLEALETAGLDTLVGPRMHQLKEVHPQALRKRGRFTQLSAG
jgi:transposase